MLTQEEVNSFVEEANLHLQHGDMEEILGPYFGFIPDEGSPRQRLRAAVRYIISKAFVHQPPLMEALFQRLEGYGMNCTKWRTLWKQGEPRVFHTGHNAWNTPFLPDEAPEEQPFFDRHDIRQALERLLDDEPLPFHGAMPLEAGPPRVCAIVHPREPRRQGRTHLYRYLKYRVKLQPFNAGLGLAYVNFRDHEAMESEKFLAVLADELGPGIEPFPALGSSSIERWHRHVIEWLATSLLYEKWWYIALDNFDDPDVPSSTLRLIDALIHYLTLELEDRRQLVPSPHVARNCPIRLVLLGYDEQRFGKVPGLNRRRLSQLPLSPISKEDVVRHLQSLLARHSPTLPDVETVAQQMADGIMLAVEQAGPPDDDRLPLLCRTTSKILHNLGLCAC